MPVLINPYAFGVVTNDHALTAGSYAIYTGYFAGNAGALVTDSDSHGYTIVRLIDAFLDLGVYGQTKGASYFLSGNHTGAQFTSIVANGVTLARADADVAAGTYFSSADATFWSWNSQLWGFATGNMYAVTINP